MLKLKNVKHIRNKYTDILYNNTLYFNFNVRSIQLDIIRFLDLLYQNMRIGWISNQFNNIKRFVNGMIDFKAQNRFVLYLDRDTFLLDSDNELVRPLHSI